jgi:hypothetical protein
MALKYFYRLAGFERLNFEHQFLVDFRPKSNNPVRVMLDQSAGAGNKWV